MTDVPADVAFATPKRRRFRNWQARLMASRKFQKWAAGFPLTRGLVRREGEAMFDLLAGFCHSQVLMALVKLKIPHALMDGPATVQELALASSVPPERMEILLRAGVALKLLKHKRAGRFGLTRTGAALVGVPGLVQMIDHHDVLYRDLSDPVAFFRGEVETELADFWPYVFGGDMDPAVAATFSDLMADSQVLVAEDTLRAISLKGVHKLMDVGGGSGAFLKAVGQAYKNIDLTLFDLPEVAPAATHRFANASMASRLTVQSGSFKTQAIPFGADAISLIRVLYDHSDETVADLLSKCFDALPSGGRLIISEPMLGDTKPERAGDVYFALYTLAMRTGKARSAASIGEMCRDAGFSQVTFPKASRPFVTRCIDVRKV